MLRGKKPSTKPLDLIQGTLDLLILNTLSRRAEHGYGISREIRERTGGVLAIQDAALYQALRRMEERGWIKAEWKPSENNRRARYYELTPRGQNQLRSETASWKLYVEAVFKVLEPRTGEAR